jgi:hypothetical protein
MRFFLHSAVSFAALLVIAQASSCVAQQRTDGQLAPPAATRVTSPMNTGARVALSGYTAPKSLARYDQGPASASLATGRMALLLNRDAPRQEALREYLGSLQDPHAANYHKWLTPRQSGRNVAAEPGLPDRLRSGERELYPVLRHCGPGRAGLPHQHPQLFD